MGVQRDIKNQIAEWVADGDIKNQIVKWGADGGIQNHRVEWLLKGTLRSIPEWFQRAEWFLMSPSLSVPSPPHFWKLFVVGGTGRMKNSQFQCGRNASLPAMEDVLQDLGIVEMALRTNVPFDQWRATCCQTHQSIQESGLLYTSMYMPTIQRPALAISFALAGSHQLSVSQTAQSNQSSNSFSLVLGRTEASFLFPVQFNK